MTLKIGIIGAGYVGRGIAELALKAGHEVMISNSRDPRSLFSTVGMLSMATSGGISHPIVSAGTPREVAAFGDIIIIAVPLFASDSLPSAELAGKIVVDACNYYPERDGRLPPLEDGSMTSSGLVASYLPGARLVKAFNAVPASDLIGGAPVGNSGRRALPIAGDDAEANQAVAELHDEFGFDTVDVGVLSEGWRFAPDTPVYCVPMTKAQLIAALG